MGNELFKIPHPQRKPITEDEYWKQQLDRDKGMSALPVMAKCCHDCAMESGFYQSFADSLINQPKEAIQEIISKWFCHNNPKRACKGIYDFIDNQ